MIAEVQEKSRIDEIVDFIIENYDEWDGTPRSKIEDLLAGHSYYGTCDVLVDKKGILATVRWNVTPSGDIAEVYDLIIRKDERNKKHKIIKGLIARSWMKFPSLKYIRFSRYDKYPYRKSTLYKIERFFRGGR